MAKKKPSGNERAPWQVASFPVEKRNRFIGICKTEGHTVPDMLEYLLDRLFREKKQEAEKEIAG